MKSKKAVVLLSGGLDSTTTLYWAIDQGYECYALIFNYGQKHYKEVKIAENIAKLLGVKYQIINLEFPWKGSALLDKELTIPKNRNIDDNIPLTYVPGRNIIFLSIATSYAEVIKAETILIGANSIDYSGYPDCRPEFIKAMQNAIMLGTKDGKINIETPLITLSKKDIILLGLSLGVPYEETWSCYIGEDEPCGVCDSCILRKKGFEEACKSIK
ncbi:MAG: 7-cyano-7-deazaguanine synthase QueC [bacterium]|nr:7-cyano-7-deazaguanine synthase QueC [bacterium]